MIKKYQQAEACSIAQRWELQDIMKLYGKEYRQNKSASYVQQKVMGHIENCRTAVLGGHMEACTNCGEKRNSYNSCRDRHCPKCQTMVKERWLSARKSELLPCGYFHNVFTIPHILNPLILCNQEVCYSILFSAVSETLQAFAKDPQWRLTGKLGFIAILHTWSQTLIDHFHLHCLIPAGVLSFDKSKWKPAREKKKYLFKITSLAKEFKKRYISKLRKAYEDGWLIFVGETEQFGSMQNFENLLKESTKKRWLAYTKRPFAGPEQVLEYLGRYTHRVAISNNRIKNIDNGKVTFTYRDRANGNKIREMSLPAKEFIRRFLLHVLPKGFMKIRYFGFLSPRNKKWSIPLLRKLIDPKAKFPELKKETIQEMMLRLTGKDIFLCPKCGKGQMVRVKEIMDYYSMRNWLYAMMLSPL